MRFIGDVMMGKLMKYLRLLGFDAEYGRNGRAVDFLRRRDPDRLLLTTRRRFAHLPHVVCVTARTPREQLMEIRSLLKEHISEGAVLSRCIRCNAELAPVEKKDVEPLVPEFVFHTYALFKICPSCKRVFWEGTHVTGMENLAKEVLA
jgi:uncharacterized protein